MMGEPADEVPMQSAGKAMASVSIPANIPGRDVLQLPARQVRGSDISHQLDAVAVEEPLEIRLRYEKDGKRVQEIVSVTMRTPGNDRELAIGYLVTEGIVSTENQIQQASFCGAATESR